MRWHVTLLMLLLATPALAAPTTLPAHPADGKLPHIQVDLPHKLIRVECQAVNAEMALELFLCVAGTAEHETVLRTKAKPSHLHLAMLMLRLEPGEPAHYSEKDRRTIAPRGPGLRLSCEFDKEGQTVRIPAERLMRNQKTRQEMPPARWVFAGSRFMEDGQYAADLTGHIVTVVNFPYSLIDVPEVRSSANETLEWEVNPAAAPKRGQTVWLIIEPADRKD